MSTSTNEKPPAAGGHGGGYVAQNDRPKTEAEFCERVAAWMIRLAERGDEYGYPWPAERLRRWSVAFETMGYVSREEAKRGGGHE